MLEHPDIVRWRAATPEDIDAIWRLQQSADTVDHPQQLSPRSAVTETFDTSSVDTERDTIVALGPGDELRAHGVVMVAGGHATRVQEYLFGTVHPEWRGRGIGTALLHWLRVRAEQKLAENELSLPGWIELYADAEKPDQRGLAEAEGFSPARYFAEMVHPLTEEIPAVQLPEGLELLAFSDQLSEATRIARNDAFRDHWGAQPNTKERWNHQQVGGHSLPSLSWVAVTTQEPKQRVAGFVLSTILQPSGLGYIELVGVIRDWRGRRLAPALLAQALRTQREAGLPGTSLEVDSDSPTGANTLYERMGFSTVGTSIAYLREY